MGYLIYLYHPVSQLTLAPDWYVMLCLDVDIQVMELNWPQYKITLFDIDDEHELLPPFLYTRLQTHITGTRQKFSLFTV